MYSATVTPELFFLRRKYKKESLEGPSLAKVKDLEEQGWITEAEAHKELKELKAIRDDIHQEFSEEKNGAGAPNEEKDNVPSPIYSSSLYTAVCEVPVLR